MIRAAYYSHRLTLVKLFLSGIVNAMIDPINELRKRIGKGTQAALAEEIGVSPPFLCLVLKGASEGSRG